MTVKLPESSHPQAIMDSYQAPPAGNAARSLIDKIPLPLVLFLANPYLAGKDADDAIRKAHELYSTEKFSGTLDVLGEDAESTEDCERYVKTYMELIDKVSAKQVQCSRPRQQLTISMKPSMFSASPPGPSTQSKKHLDDAFDRINKVVDYALQKNIHMTLEAEDHRWTNFHLEAYFALINAGYTNLGTVVQSRLFRTEKDILRFDERMRVRLVIGIYIEPPAIAHTEKPIMKELLVKYAAQLASQGVYLEIATHDSNCVDRFVSTVALPLKVPASQFEFQFLLGVPRKKLQRELISGTYFEGLATADDASASHVEGLSKDGSLVRMYLPFGRDRVAGPYCRRRLKANPNMMVYGIKNALGLQ